MGNVLASRHDHARLVEAAVRGSGLAVSIDARVRASWKRCLQDGAMDPVRPKAARLVRAAELRQRRDEMQPLYDIARIEMRGLTQLLNSPVGVMLTDLDGVIVGYVGDPRFAEMAYRSGLRDGAVWSEAEQGTNGMGTSLVTRAAVIVDGAQHFLFQNTGLTCCGAPVRDGAGNLVGALNISGRVRLSGAPTLALVRLAVQNVENRALLCRHAGELVLRFHPHREFIGAAGEGILVVGDDGRVTAANPGALEWLHLPHHDAIIGHTIDDIVGLDIEALHAWSTHPAEAGRLPTRESGSLCFGIVQLPVARAAAAVPLAHHCSAPGPAALESIRDGCTYCASHSSLDVAEHEALAANLDACDWNVTAAANRLGLSRRTLHRKIRQHGLRRGSVQ